jgi:hypothetical protein
MVETIWTKLHRTSLRTSRRYLELSGVNALVRDLRDKDIRTKIRLRATGATHGGIPFERGSLFYLLRNRFYIGEVKSSPSSSAASKAARTNGSRNIAESGFSTAHSNSATFGALNPRSRGGPPA